MKFFIPSTEDKDQDAVYETIKAHLKELGFEASDRKIFKLNYKHNGENHCAEVGKKEDYPDGEEVIAIIYEELRNLYHVCTPNRGVTRGISILVGGDEVLSVTDFD
ncbi:MAG: hypothetical protein K0U19_05340 [Proteobacteria bacterium]|nr:hypothetical protein [Pseudomonadota bacterium]